MTENFLNYEQSLAVKELGFDEGCLYQYNSFGELSKLNVGFIVKNQLLIKDFCAAPLKSQFFKWLRDKKLTDASINRHGTHDGGYSYRWEIVHEYGVYEERHFKLGYKTYEEAEDACIDKIIEIIKLK